MLLNAQQSKMLTELLSVFVNIVLFFILLLSIVIFKKHPRDFGSSRKR